MRRTLFYSLFVALALVMASCYPGGIEYYEDTDIVFTSYEPEYDFMTQQSYTMPDNVVKITGDDDLEFIDEPYNTMIINRIKSNMETLGWNLVEDPNDADLVLLPASWTNTSIYYWYDYWCWYYPWYCGWGWYYPGTAVSYTTGTLVMTMIENDDAIEPYRVWTAAINGLLSGGNDMNRVNKGIDQAFEQSPYLAN